MQCYHANNELRASFLVMPFKLSTVIIIFIIKSCLFRSRCSSASRSSHPLLGHCTLTESISESSVDNFEMTHAAYALSSSSASFLTPVKLADAFLRVAASRAQLLLDVIAAASTSTTQRVRFVMTLSKA